MGCCVSTSTNSPPPSKTPHRISNSPFTNTKSPPQSHPIPEEETVVKEVPNPLNENPSIKSVPEFDKKHQNDTGLEKHPVTFKLSEEVSEICSTISLSTMADEKNTKSNDEFYEVGLGYPTGSKSRCIHDRTFEPTDTRVRPGNEKGDMRMENVGESSSKRSRSPVLRMDSGLSRPGFVRGQSPGRVGSRLSERVQVDEGKESEDRLSETNGHRHVMESLENPLVSLECFIFL